MLKRKTQKRLRTAINSVGELQTYLERALRKLDEEAGDTSGNMELMIWLNQQVSQYRRRRDAEP